MMNRNKKWFALIPFVIIAAASLFGWIVMLLWNAILVPAAGAGVISFWQGLGLLALSRILVGGMWKGGGGGHRWGGGHAWKQKWAGMSDEEKAKFKQEWRRRCGHFPESNVQASSENKVTGN